MSALANSCPLISKINLSHCKNITDIGITALAHGCPLLSDIDFSHCGQLTDIGGLGLLYLSCLSFILFRIIPVEFSHFIKFQNINIYYMICNVDVFDLKLL